MAPSSQRKRGHAVGKAKRGKGTKIMLVAGGNGLMIGLQLASAKHHEAKLAVPALQTEGASRARRQAEAAPQ